MAKEGEMKKGRLNFDGRSDESVFVICKVKKDGNELELRDKARKLCKALFSGSVPRPSVGWWKKHEGGEGNGLQTDLWRPKAIISVTGGARNFKVDEKDAEANERKLAQISAGILKAAHAFKAMIVTGGSNEGVMKLVGDAVERDGDRIATLGIYPFGTLQEISRFESKRRIGPHEMRTKDAPLDGNHHFFALIDDNSRGEDAWGTEIPSRYEIEYVLSELPQKSNKKDTKEEEQLEAPVLPHVLVVVNGGPGTFDTALKLSQMEKQDEDKEKVIPIVVVEGTGRAADLIAVTWRLLHTKYTDSKEEDKLKARQTELSNQLEKERKVAEEKKKAKSKSEDKGDKRSSVGQDNSDNTQRPSTETCEGMSNSSGQENDDTAQNKTDAVLQNADKSEKDDPAAKSDNEVLKQVKEICKDKETVTIWNFNDSHSLGYAMMKSICRGTLIKPHDKPRVQKLTPTQQLKLVLAWNDVDGEVIEMAKKEILLHFADDLGIGKERGAEHSPYQKRLTQLLVQGLKHRKVRFVEMLLDFDVILPVKEQMELLFTVSADGQLDLKSKTPGASVTNQAKKIAGKEDSHQEILRRMVKITRSRQLEYWLRIGRKGNLANSPSKSVLDPQEILSSFMGWRLFTPFADETTREHLFLWCILTGRKEMAELFWRKCHPDLKQQCISRALFACAIARTLGPRMLPRHIGMFVAADEDGDGPDLASRFEYIATEILDQCYKKSPRDAVLALTCPLLHPSQYIWVDQMFKGRRKYLQNEKFLTPITLAFDAEAEAFVEHAAFQECLDRIWYGRLVTRREELKTNPSTEVEGFRVMSLGLLSWWFRNELEDMREWLASLDIILQALLIFPVMFSDDSYTVRKERSSPFYRLLAFYSAPVVKFYMDFASYLCFLLMYTYVGLRMEYEYTPLEGVVHAWIISLALIEIRDWTKFGKRYLNSISNFFDFAILLFYVPAAILRIYERTHFDSASFQALGGGNATDVDNLAGQLLQHNALARYPVPGEDFIKARSWHGMAGIFFWLRITDFFRVSRKLGPLMLVLMKVFWNAFQFFVILLIFIVSFGAAIICAGRPRYDSSISMAKYVEQMVFLPYIMIFGEHFMDGFAFSMDNYPVCDAIHDDCSPNAKLGVILMCLYLFISTILLMNLLIAMMNSSYNQVLSKSTRAWKYERLEFVLSYSAKSILPLPLSVVAWLGEPLLDRVLRCMNGTSKSAPFIHLRKDRLKQYCALEWELRKLQSKEQQHTSNGLNVTSDLVYPLSNPAAVPPIEAALPSNNASSPIPANPNRIAEEDVLQFKEVKAELNTLDNNKQRTEAEEQLLSLLEVTMTPLKDEGLKSELEGALTGFAEGDTVGEILYKHTQMMASLYQDVYLEDWWLQHLLEHHPSPAQSSNASGQGGTPSGSQEGKGADSSLDPKVRNRADVMRRCVNTITSAGVKWVSGPSANKVSK